MKTTFLIAAAAWLCTAPIRASVNVTVSFDAGAPQGAVAGRFAGLGFESGELKPDNGITGFMMDTNLSQSPKCGEVQQLATNMDLRNIRVGGDTVDNLRYGVDYSTPGIDALFSFASAINANVIYSVRLLGSTTYDAQTDSVNAAGYVWSHYQNTLDFFAIGNEPNFHSYHTYSGHTLDPRIFETTSGQPGTAYPSFAHNANGEWKVFANAISAANSGAAFGGPDTGDTGTSTTTFWSNGTKNVGWTEAMVEDRKSGNIGVPLTAGTQHYYVGNTAGGLTQDQAISAMLSAAWVNTNYPQEWNALFQSIVQSDGWHYRFTEADDYLGGVNGASNAFAAALWALDFMDWEASKSSLCQGVNFHSLAAYTRTYFLDSGGDYHVYPKAAALKVFGLSTPSGTTVNVLKANKTGGTINLTAYAFGNATDLYVTLINKTSAVTGDAASATVTITPSNFTATAAHTIEMQGSTPGDPTSSDATVGGDTVNHNDAGWNGSWSSLSVNGSGKCTVTVGPASATLVHIHG